MMISRLSTVMISRPSAVISRPSVVAILWRVSLLTSPEAVRWLIFILVGDEDGVVGA